MLENQLTFYLNDKEIKHMFDKNGSETFDLFSVYEIFTVFGEIYLVSDLLEEDSFFIHVEFE